MTRLSLKRIYTGILASLVIILRLTLPAHADPKSPSVILDNGIVITTNELPSYGQLIKKYPVRRLIDKAVGTTWVYEDDREKKPKIILDVPQNIKIEKIGIINGCAESLSTYYDNNRIDSIDIKYSTSKLSQQIKLNTDLLLMQYYDLDANKGPMRIYLNINHSRIGKKINNTCISVLDVVSDGHSLINPDIYIASDGGEYPVYELYIKQKRTTKFEDNVVDAFFIENGQYAIFKHGLGSLGITMCNTRTGKQVHVLKTLGIQSIIWQDGYFVGTASTYDNREIKFRKKVQLP